MPDQLRQLSEHLYRPFWWWVAFVVLVLVVAWAS